MLGKLTFLWQHLALAAFTLPATNRFQIDSESLCCLQHAGPDRNLATQTRGHEQYADFFFHRDQTGFQIAVLSCRATAATGAPATGTASGAFGRRFPELLDPARAIRIFTQHDIGTETRGNDFSMQGVGNR